MKKVRESIRNIIEDNSWLVVIIVLIAAGFLSHWISAHSVLGEIQKQWSEELFKAPQ